MHAFCGKSSSVGVNFILMDLTHALFFEQSVLIEVEKYKRQKCGDSNEVYYARLKALEFEEDWVIKGKMTIANGFWRETIYLWKQVPACCESCSAARSSRNIIYLDPAYIHGWTRGCNHAALQKAFCVHALVSTDMHVTLLACSALSNGCI